MGYKTYEIKDWLGTPRLTFSDIKLPRNPNDSYSNYTYKLDYLSAATTYPFGARIDSLSFESPSYRFGFTGHLKDNNIRPEKGDGANYSTLFREYDPIIGRWWSIDPFRAKYAGMSPYNYAAGNPISLFDPDGGVIYPRNLTEIQKEQYNLNISFWKSCNNEYVNSIINKAEGPDTQIDLYFMPANTDNLNPSTESRIFKDSFIENMWKYDSKGIQRRSPSGQTYSSKREGVSDIIMNADHIEGNMDNGDLNPYGISPLSVLDELNHALSKEKRDNLKEIKDHKTFFNALMEQINCGKLKVNENIIREIEEKIKEVNEKENRQKGNTDEASKK